MNSHGIIIYNGVLGVKLTKVKEEARMLKTINTKESHETAFAKSAPSTTSAL